MATASTVIEAKPVRVFTRDQPCTKVEIWNCFRGASGFLMRPVVETRGEIGLNVPKYLRTNDFARLVSKGNADYYQLTPEGIQWLSDGLKRHLELHPEDKRRVQNYGTAGTKRVVRRKA